jgi:hypothetical protein
MPDTRRAERVLQKWLDNQITLLAIAGVTVEDSSLVAASLRGRLSLLPDQDVLILKSEAGSFLNIASWGTAKLLEVKSDWQGTMIEVHFPHEILLVADYEPPPDFFNVCHSRRQTTTA